MALPLIVFFFLVIVAVSLFVIGFTRFSVGAGFSFTILAGVFFILTGLLLWTTGLQLDTTSSFDTSTDTIGVTYETLTFSNNLEIQILSYFLTFGGFFPIVLAIRNVFAFNQNKTLKANEEWSI